MNQINQIIVFAPMSPFRDISFLKSIMEDGVKIPDDVVEFSLINIVSI